MKLRPIIFCILLTFFCSGCGTIMRDPPNRPAYGGVLTDGRLIAEGSPEAIIDVPFSFVADTLFLPFDLCFIINHPATDPLEGWTFQEFDDFAVPRDRHHYRVDRVISDDYQDFIRKNGLGLMGSITGFYENRNGQHAVEFTAMPPNHDVSWSYVLIYNKENKRIKVIKWNKIRYEC